MQMFYSHPAFSVAASLFDDDTGRNNNFGDDLVCQFTVEAHQCNIMNDVFSSTSLAELYWQMTGHRHTAFCSETVVPLALVSGCDGRLRPASALDGVGVIGFSS